MDGTGYSLDPVPDVFVGAQWTEGMQPHTSIHTNSTNDYHRNDGDLNRQNLNHHVLTHGPRNTPFSNGMLEKDQGDKDIGHEREEDVALHDDDDSREDEATYAIYASKRIREKYPHVREHPDPLVETASLRSVPLPPLNFEHCLDEEVARGVLSDAQLETVVYANMRFNSHERPRPGFFLGDGAGVGKGRQIAALIKQHWHDGGRRVLWVSVSTDLRIDSRRDLDDINAHDIEIWDNNTPKVNFEGVAFVTYSLLRTGLPKTTNNTRQGDENDQVESLDRLTSVSSQSNLAKIIKWLSLCPEGSLIIFDESHKAKNLLPSVGSAPTQTGRAVMYLQESLPDAKVLYSSATGASEPRNLAYMERLGIGGIGNNDEVVKLLVNARLEALELAAMSLKSAGAYLGRTLSYQGAEFDLVKVELEMQFKIMYDRSTILWENIFSVMKALSMKRWAARFWGAHQRFFKSMLMAGKVPAITRLAIESIKNGMCVVIGLQSTGEAATEQTRARNEEITDLISAPRMSLVKLISTSLSPDDLIERLDEKYRKQGEPCLGQYLRDDLVSIIDVHKVIYDAAMAVGDQPSIHDIIDARPCLESHYDELDNETSLDSLTDQIKEIKKRITYLTATKNKTQLTRIKLRHLPEKEQAAQLNMVESEVASIEEEIKLASREITELLKARDELSFGSENQDTLNEAEMQRKRQLSRNARTKDACKNALKVIPQSLKVPYSPPDNISMFSKEEVIRMCEEIQCWLLYIAENLDLPANPLDSLIHNLGGPDSVAELTGRKGGIFFDDDGQAEYKERRPDEIYSKKDINLVEKDAFMSGKKLIAIISDASSTGISLQADRRALNKRRRCHITLELPWSADKAIQQFGRSHRANQVSAPCYKMVVTPCGGEYRFACAASKRLASLGALLRGDRNALGAGADLKSFDIDSNVGSRSLSVFCKSFCTFKVPEGGKGIVERKLPVRMEMGLVDQTLSPNEKFLTYFARRFDKLGIEYKGSNQKIVTFLNRLLGFPIDEQQILFEYFTDVMEHTKDLMKNEGSLDRGILRIDAQATVANTEVVYTNEKTQSTIYHHVVQTDRGKSWEYVSSIMAELKNTHFESTPGVAKHSGFYCSKNTYLVNGARVKKVKMITVIPDEFANEVSPFKVTVKSIEPCVDQPKVGKLSDALRNNFWTKVSDKEGEELWNKWFSYLEKRCIHGDACSRYEWFGTPPDRIFEFFRRVTIYV